MERPLSPALVPALLLLLLTACGADASDPAGVDGAGGTDGAVASACLEGAEDCDDIPTGTGGPQSGADGSVPVAEAVAAGIDGPFLMSGFYLAAGDDARLCEALAESFPPQCGGASIRLDPGDVPEGATTTTEGEVTWSEEPISVEGQIDGDVFVVGSP
jgi:hypothetical protein